MGSDYTILSQINSVHDLKSLPEYKLKPLADELRHYIIDVVSRTGGHLASNLGVVELTIALHRVFDSPDDKIIWDVGHQSYAHKILTGRREGFKNLRQYKGVSGFPKRIESEHDIFETGHSSTSISAALGILTGQELQLKKGNVIAVIGDGSLTGGMALEALNHAGHLGKRLIIILNDNKMSIGQNVGGLSVHLTKVTTTRTYNMFRRYVDNLVKKIPFFGSFLLQFIYRVKRSLKAFFFRANIFADLGYEYVGPLNGHNIHSLIHVMTNIVKNMDRPTVVHVATKKGKGYSHAEINPARFHGVGAFSILDGESEDNSSAMFTDAFAQALVDKAQQQKEIIAITAAMASGTGLIHFQKKFPQRFFDVGICEQHAVTFAAGLAASGLRPVVAIYSTFMQRAVDQLIHDVALQKLPVVFALDRAGIVGNDGETHHGVFDISLFRGIPNIAFLSPASREEMEIMLKYCLERKLPSIIRYPRAVCITDSPELSLPIEEGRGVFLEKNSADILIVTLGGTIPEVQATKRLLGEQGIEADIYNLRFIKPIDLEYFLGVVSKYDQVFFIEDGVLLGGIGEYLGSELVKKYPHKTYTLFGVPDTFVEHGSRSELFELCGLSPNRISERISGVCGRKPAVLRARNNQ
ncbi:MAG: 1-deoxy-D-xylulose-5-phosphate synthase [Spirochaetales bacterium]|nr:1-deoxy-D-xylulose-5-phosphate synthase [Spirochaetales bacterium]